MAIGVIISVIVLRGMHPQCLRSDALRVVRTGIELPKPEWN